MPTASSNRTRTAPCRTPAAPGDSDSHATSSCWQTHTALCLAPDPSPARGDDATAFTTRHSRPHPTAETATLGHHSGVKQLIGLDQRPSHTASSQAAPTDPQPEQRGQPPGPAHSTGSSQCRSCGRSPSGQRRHTCSPRPTFPRASSHCCFPRSTRRGHSRSGRGCVAHATAGCGHPRIPCLASIVQKRVAHGWPLSHDTGREGL